MGIVKSRESSWRQRLVGRLSRLHGKWGHLTSLIRILVNRLVHKWGGRAGSGAGKEVMPVQGNKSESHLLCILCLACIPPSSVLLLSNWEMNNVCTQLWILRRILDKAWKIKQANSQISMCFIVRADCMSVHVNEFFNLKGAFSYLLITVKLQLAPQIPICRNQSGTNQFAIKWTERFC